MLNVGDENTIDISERADGGLFTVRHGDRYADGLTRDEALWAVACVLTAKQCPWMKTTAEHEARSRAVKEITSHKENT